MCIFLWLLVYVHTYVVLIAIRSLLDIVLIVILCLNVVLIVILCSNVVLIAELHTMLC